jgi:hypothetical protein
MQHKHTISEHHVLFDFQVIAIYSAIRLGEWAQNDNVCHLNQIRTNIDSTPTAFSIDDLELFGRNKQVMSHVDALANQELILQIDVRWRFKKMKKSTRKNLFSTWVFAKQHSAVFPPGSVSWFDGTFFIYLTTIRLPYLLIPAWSQVKLCSFDQPTLMPPCNLLLERCITLRTKNC